MSIMIHFCKFADEFASKNFPRIADTCSLHFIQRLQLEHNGYGEYTNWHLRWSFTQRVGVHLL